MRLSGIDSSIIRKIIAIFVLFSNMHEFILLILFLAQGIGDARKIKIGGSSRGSSAARTNAAGVQPYQAGGFQPHQAGGWQSHQAGGFQPHQPGGFQPHQTGGFHPSGGFPSNQPR
ncbi:unnamed protein product [Gongylonema pulchrum]|uniref:Uncharacterized protein n=1 Tax=Gongylonema pulchrum TaxID=637853 RepID=A0A183DAG9_9BILA|nr:unnamed protein product [Gongylonema pulchrum]